MTESDPRNILVITGTGARVGKTVVTAALAALALAAGLRVAVVKPAQTGVSGHGGDAPDLGVVSWLSGVSDTHELVRFTEPLSPEAAARVSGLPPADLRAAAVYIADLADSRDLVLVEGSGGLLERYDPAGTTIADLAAALDAPALLVTAAGPGTLNHTALCLEALRARKVPALGVVVGSWPAEPGLAEHENLTDLQAIAGEPLAGFLPAGSATLPPAEFLAVARAGLSPRLGGQLS